MGQREHTGYCYIALLGGLRVCCQGREIDHFPTRKVAGLLAYLALRMALPQPREVLIEEFWPDQEESAARNSLSAALSALRRLLEPPDCPRGSVLITDRSHVRLNAALISTDVARFEHLISRAERTRSATERVDLRRQALTLYRGDLLPGFYQDWAVHEALRLQSLREHLESLPPLGDEETLPPAPAEYHAFPATRLANIPLRFRLTRFFGRETETAVLAGLLLPDTPLERPRPRLITLTGGGGTGKTRLALETAQQLEVGHQWPFVFVDLTEITDPRQVAPRIAAALQLTLAANTPPLEQVITFLSAGAPPLLLLDNLEQLLVRSSQGEDIGDILSALLERVPNLCCLCTSRQRVGLAGEREFPLSALPIPEESSRTPEALLVFPAVRMYVDRAQAVRPDFQITTANAESIATLCRWLEGLPLAIELAAPWVRTLPPRTMVARFADPLSLPEARERGLPARHRTLRATLGTSYALLPIPAQQLFARLSVFAGGWTVAACAAVYGGTEEDTLSLLATLEAASLISGIPEPSIDAAGEQIRYRFLETVRAFAGECLEQAGPEESRTLRDCHLDWCIGLSEAAVAAMDGPQQETWLNYLEAEHANLRAALDGAITSGATVAGCRLAVSLYRFWYARGHHREGREWLERFLSLLPAAEADSPETALLRARALNGAGFLAMGIGDLETAREQFEAALALYRDRESAGVPYTASGIGEALNNLGTAVRLLGNFDHARRLCEEGLAYRRRAGDEAGVAESLNSLGLIARSASNYPIARPFFENSLAIRRARNDRQGMAESLNCLGVTAVYQGDFATANTLFAEALALRREAGHSVGIAAATQNLGVVLAELGDTDAGRALQEEGLRIKTRLGARGGIACSLLDLGKVDLTVGDLSSAEERFGKSVALYRQTGDREGLANSLTGLGRTRIAQQDLASALCLLREAAELRGRIRHLVGVAESLEAMAEAEAAVPRRENLVAAASLLGTATALRRTLNAPPLPSAARFLASLWRRLEETFGEEAAHARAQGEMRPWESVFEEWLEGTNTEER